MRSSAAAFDTDTCTFRPSYALSGDMIILGVG